MISVDDALAILRERVPTREARLHAVESAIGLRLARDVVSSRDIPSFDKSQMDGLALRSRDVENENDSVRVVGTVVAGKPFSGHLQPGQAVRIMTGGVIPDGCDCVMPRELAEISADGTVCFRASPRPGDHLVRRGELIRAGDTVLAAGTPIGAAQLALLLEIGSQSVLARPRIRAAVLATGSELVEKIDDAVEGHIANTNGPMLAALLGQFGCHVTPLGVAADDAERLRPKIEAGLQFDLFLTSGGVSVGDRDLVPDILSAAGVRSWFHRVSMKPGRPLWFGTTESGTVVMGLPGNPVSSYVGFQLFVRTALAVMTAEEELAPDWHHVPSRSPWKGKGDRETFWPARRHGGPTVESAPSTGVEFLPWRGSSDLRTLAAATGLARLPAGTSAIEVGDGIDYMACGSAPGSVLAFRQGTLLAGA